eukprot:CAMPEP_0119475294 /NCGR_PEP_ID=MMETSP1344-20130328/6233_1 /TAXON_ID=236787 /ORGANISM="Florenciella parvula, Strain CCMP2471" /LENGTH=111 /DNA_ID=CAMNT_0007508775 /DNA_START=157 /DNA_END=490 /DNA_ORIENTATION=-
MTQEENDAAEASFKEMMAGDSPIIKPCPNCQVACLAVRWARMSVLGAASLFGGRRGACPWLPHVVRECRSRPRVPHETPPHNGTTRQAPILKTAGCNFMTCSSCNSPDKMC